MHLAFIARLSLFSAKYKLFINYALLSRLCTPRGTGDGNNENYQ